MTKIQEYRKKNGSKCYRFAFYAGIDAATGKKKYIHKQGFSSVRDAKIALNALELQKVRGDLVLNNNDFTFEEIAIKYIEIKKTSLRQSTYLLQENYLKRILSSFDKLKLKDIKTYHCQNAVDAWYKETPASTSAIKNLASQVFDYAIKNEYISSNPMRGVIMPKRPNKKRENNYYTKQELSEFLEFVKRDKPDFYALFRLLAYSGMRIGEALALNWGDIDLNNSTITINKTLSRIALEGATDIEKPKTAAGMRTIYLDSETTQILRDHQQAQKKRLLARGKLNNLSHPLAVFDKGMGAEYIDAQGERYTRTSDIRRVLNSIYKGMPNDFKRITLHGFRHTHATLLIESGANIKAVQARLGHTDIKTTLSIYAHATQKMETDAINQLTAYMEN